jgi:hypothetical protein
MLLRRAAALRGVVDNPRRADVDRIVVRLNSLSSVEVLEPRREQILAIQDELAELERAARE